MPVRGWSRLLGWAACISLLCTLTAWLRLDRQVTTRATLIHPYANWDLDRREPLPLDSQACILPRVHPFDSSVLPYLGTPKPIVCKVRQYPLTLVDDSGRLMFNKSALTESGYHASRLDCQYSQLFRPEGDDFHIGYGPWKKLKPDGVKLTSDFVAVVCYNFIGLTVYDYMHAHIVKVPPPSRESPKGPTSNSTSNDGFYSVFVFGIDSLSRLGVVRQLPKTYQYLTEEMGAYVFRGMTKVGDNTFPNLAAVLTGKPLDELPSGDKTKYYDEWPCIWKDFASQGYTTMFAEDQPHLGLFNYLREGLRSQPTDHYLRPYWLAVEVSTLHRLSSNMCYGGVPKHLLQLGYARNFVRAYRGTPSFGFSFLVELSHDYVSRVTVADQDFESWLRGLHTSGHLDRTVLIFLSDHGHRFDPVRATLVGRIEERMPFLALYLPPSLLQDQPHVAADLELNTARLTSLFDAHATMLDVLQLSGAPPHRLGETRTGKGMSLFGPLPANRTCDQAGIPTHYCICEEETPFPKNDELAVSASRAVVQSLNGALQESNFSSLCALLKLKSIERVDVVKASRRVQHNSRISFGKHLEDSTVQGMLSKLRVQIKTEPGGGEFEATVEHRADEDVFSVFKDVSRINMYGNQSWCVNDANIRKYCYCLKPS